MARCGVRLRHVATTAAAALTVSIATRPAAAQTGPSAQPAAPAERAGPVPGPTGTGQPSQQGNLPAAAPTGFWQRSNLLGDLGGLRPWLSDRGISFGLTETSEVLGNPTGGRHQGMIYEGLTQMSLGIDMAEAFGLTGGIFNVSAFQIHGRGLTVNDVGNLNTVSSIEATRATRLFELWYQQSFLGGRIDVRIGQLAADQEFLLSQYSGLFINSSFGWPALSAIDLPSGGPAYPLATPAVRVRAQPYGQLTLLAGVFNGDPAGPGIGDPQLRHPSGANFELNSGLFVIAEAQYANNQGDNATGLPGIFKIGAWHNSQPFADQRFDPSGIPLASPLSTGRVRQRRNNYSIYASADQLVYRPPGSKDGGAGVFVRVKGASSDRNLVNFFADAGITYKGLIKGRENDTVGIGVGYTRISDAARKADSDRRFFTGTFFPIRNNETVLEITYQYQVTPWWLAQPDFQYVFTPGGGMLNSDRPGKRIGDAAIFGLRTSIIF
jgi:porin